MGASVIAAAAGRVTTVDYNSSRGYYIVIDHGNGYATLYQHLSRQDVAVGGCVIAYHWSKCGKAHHDPYYCVEE